MCFYFGYKHLENEKSREQKNSKTKKNLHPSITHHNDRNRSLSDQTLSWFSKKDFCLNKRANKINLLILQQMAVMLLSLRKIKSKIIGTSARSSIIPVIEKTTMPARAQIKSRKTSTSLDNLSID